MPKNGAAAKQPKMAELVECGEGSSAGLSKVPNKAPVPDGPPPQGSLPWLAVLVQYSTVDQWNCSWVLRTEDAH